jgi:hypothetical protein
VAEIAILTALNAQDAVRENSTALLGIPAPANILCWILDRSPSQAPVFLKFVAENDSCKLYQVRDSQ